MSPTTNSVTSPFTGPHMQTTNPISGQPWSTQELGIVAKLNTFADQYYAAMKANDPIAAQQALTSRDEVLAKADDDVQAAFTLVALSQLTDNISEDDDFGD